jgi:hypothetical protein
MTKSLVLLISLLAATNAYGKQVTVALNCPSINAGVVQYGQATVESFASQIGFKIEDVRSAIKECASADNRHGVRK